jgi:riboflavin kinase/FMN adenylyltransferase
MQVLFQLDDVRSRLPAVLTIGFFDGVHRGHQRLVRRTAEFAAQERARAALVTFWPHPLTVLRPAEPVRLLTTLEEKLELLGALGGLDTTVVMPFTPELARLSPEGSLQALREHFELRGMVEGPGFAFGRDRAGNVAWLRHQGADEGFAVETLQMEAGGERISSSRIRDQIVAGQVEEAAALLGRRYTLAGTVVRGDQRGRLLGFPTANLRVDPVKLIPGNGVYAVRVRLPSEGGASEGGASEAGTSEAAAVANIGVRPTFGEGSPPVVEVHLLDSEIDLYEQRLVVQFVSRLREERRFPGVEALKAQIALDAERARALLAASATSAVNDAGGERSQPL